MFLTADGLPVFRNGTSTDGLTSAGEPVFGLVAYSGVSGTLGVTHAQRRGNPRRRPGRRLSSSRSISRAAPGASSSSSITRIRVTGPGDQCLRRGNGGTASASSQQTSTPGYRPASAAIDGDRKGAFNNAVWSPLDTYATTPHPWLQVDFPSAAVKRIVLWFGQDSGNANVGQVLAWEQEPNRCTRGADRLPTDFSVDYWNGSAWVTLTETVTTGNVYVMREYELASAVTTTKLRLNITAGQGARPLSRSLKRSPKTR
jgi:hypothetical protein